MSVFIYFEVYTNKYALYYIFTLGKKTILLLLVFEFFILNFKNIEGSVNSKAVGRSLGMGGGGKNIFLVSKNIKALYNLSLLYFKTTQFCTVVYMLFSISTQI